MSRRIKVFSIKEFTEAKYLQDLLNSLPADSFIVGMRNDYNYLYTNIFIESDFFPEVPEGEEPTKVIAIWIINKEDSSKKIEWRWCK